MHWLTDGLTDGGQMNRKDDSQVSIVCERRVFFHIACTCVYQCEQVCVCVNYCHHVQGWSGFAIVADLLLFCILI